MVAYRLSEYLMGEDVEDRLRARMDVLTTQLEIAETKFPDTPGEYAEYSRDAWNVAKVQLELILTGNRDPQLIDSTFEHLNTTRINSKYASDSWLYGVLSQKLTDAQNRLETQDQLFSIYAPIGAIGAFIVLLLALRARGQVRLQSENKHLLAVNEEKTRFVAQVSHELKTPLTSVIAFTDILSKKSKTAMSSRQSQHLSIIKRNAEYLRLLVDDLIDMSQLETGNLKMEHEEVNLHKLLSDLQMSFGPIVESKQQTIEIEPFRNSFVLVGDQLRLLQVMSNVIANASKYSDAKTKIVVSVNTNVDTVSISVQDQGYGMTSEEKTKAFDKFYRGSSPQIQQQSGTGIGLAVSKSIVKAHGGSIRMEDAVPMGTRVIIQLPIDTSSNAKGITSLFKP